MSTFKKALPLGAVILGASLRSGVVYAKQHTSVTSIVISNPKAGILSYESSSIPVLQRDDLELKFVQIFFRHGARTPFGHIPNIKKCFWDKDALFEGFSKTCVDYKVCEVGGGLQPSSDAEHLKCQVKLQGGALKGQLTAKGMRQAHDLGIRLKEHYVDKLKFLPDKYSPDVVYPRTTYIPRTVQSLACLLGGLYGDSISSQHMPVIFYTESPYNEFLSINTFRCKQFMHHYSTFFETITDSRLEHGREQLSQLLGVDEETIHFCAIRDNLIARIEHNLDIPESLLSVRELIEECSVIVMKHLLAGGDPARKDILRLSFGPAVHYICQTLEAASKKEISYKLQLNSCHDTVLMALLLSLEDFDDIWPPLTASLTFELYQDKEGNEYVRTLYKNKELRICQSEETLLPLEKFRQLLDPISVTPDEYLNDVCKSRM